MTLVRKACGALLAAAALSAAGCGGSAAPHGSPGATGIHGEATQAVTQQARHPRGAIDDEIPSSAVRLPNPCALVTRAQAQAIMQSAIRAPVLAPQGPTCIYASQDSKQQVAISILSGPRATAYDATLRDRMRVRVGARHAYCGVAGGPALRMPLRRGWLIDVSAPCPIAAAFAADALSRLSATH